ncbi:ACP S-malonyltransferase [Rhodopirellula sp. MGV]|uniref:ACP S-malonyltransferase n=1 Tax=Rhodopirellula sp. MGV TaxID=2023130 RepID=UPI000B96CA87|nr:ACP S-malonyltransferase [Rhodopirellula sp. MGV]OYP28439.1 [acyl-carrier-protein] S-malonyltransferase [Rhodopirellula sp. MGV]PNY38685.1 [acyl-carrier-protein] S-malonyltransferase [Rhodopirellula baltica]
MDVDAVGILFPGQGAQAVGMGKWLCENFSVASELFARAGEVLGYDLADLCQNGPSEKLDQTEFSQPALFTVGMAAASVLRQEQPERLAKVKATAGLSLGEYTAVCFAGGLEFDDALRLVQRRGQAMQAAADVVESGMASVIGMDLETLTALCDEVRGEGEVLRPANLLCPGNIAVSGHLSALDRLEPAALEAKAMKVVRLSVAGAFHTSLMQPAVEKLTEALAEMPIKDTQIPVYSNVDAQPHQSADEVRALLSRQVTEPVQWEASIRRMVDDGIGGFEELGTGRVLRGTLKRIQRKLPTDGFGDEA